MHPVSVMLAVRVRIRRLVRMAADVGKVEWLGGACRSWGGEWAGVDYG